MITRLTQFQYLKNLVQLVAMNSLAKENSALTGFRIYYGKDNNARKIGIVVGVDNMGKDAVKNTIFNTDAPVSSPCPPICDTSSPISGTHPMPSSTARA